MSLIEKQEPVAKKKDIVVKVTPEAFAILESYREFLAAGSRQPAATYVIERLLLLMPKLDRDFRQWRESRNQTESITRATVRRVAAKTA